MTGKDYRTVRRRWAKALRIPEAYTVRQTGLYMYHYGTHVTVRIYVPDPDNDRVKKIFEEKVPTREFPSDELIARLMLIV